MDLSRTVTEINGDFSRKSQIFPTPMYFAPPLKELHSVLGISAGGQKTRVIGLPGRTKSLTISSAVWIQSTKVTDGQTDTGRQQRPRLRIASRGKNHLVYCFVQLLNMATHCTRANTSEWDAWRTRDCCSESTAGSVRKRQDETQQQLE